MSSPSTRLLDVLVEIIATRGMEAVSVRNVAAAAGVSIGAVQHHFPTKDAMLLAAVERIGALFDERLGDLVDGTSPGAALRRIVHALAGLRPDERPGTVVWLAFVARAAVDDAVARRHRRTWSQVEGLLAGLLARHRGTSVERVADDAAELLATVDGVAVAVAVEPDRMPGARARTVLDAVVDRLLARP